MCEVTNCFRRNRERRIKKVCLFVFLIWILIFLYVCILRNASLRFRSAPCYCYGRLAVGQIENLSSSKQWGNRRRWDTSDDTHAAVFEFYMGLLENLVMFCSPRLTLKPINLFSLEYDVFMPGRCNIFGCKGNYPGEPYSPVTPFPSKKNERDERERWILASPNDPVKLCQLEQIWACKSHFECGFVKTRGEHVLLAHQQFSQGIQTLA